MNEPRQAFHNPDLPATASKRRLKTLADLLPMIGFFGVFLILGRDMILATSGLLVGLLLQLVIYKLIHQPIPKWMKILTVVALVFAAMTLVFRDPDFIKIRSSVSGFLIGCFFVGSVLIKKNVLELMLGKMIVFPRKTWNMITLLWSVPVFLNAGLNLFLANLVPGINWQISDDMWMGYRAVSGFIVVGVSFGLVILYLVVTKQRPEFGDALKATEQS
ncbi:MAG: septation protein IspZ [Gammaproteobacteria bacterium]|nr:septation protein IspZ [Gammaproteobacteria bacterium]